MANAGLSRYDILAKELVYRYKDKDATGQVALKNPKWTPHNIKTLMVCSEGCLVEYYSNKAPEVIKFAGYSEDEKSKPITAVIYDLNKVSAHLTNLRDLIIVTGGDLPLSRAVDMSRLQSLSSAFIGIYMLVAESTNSTLSDLEQLYNQLQEQQKAVIAELGAKAHGYDFNMGLEDSGVWKVCSGTRKTNGQPYELSFKGGEFTLNGSKKSFMTALNGVLSYGLFLAGKLPSLKWQRFGTASFMSQSFHTNKTDYPADSSLMNYVSSRYLCMYEMITTIQTRSKQSVVAITKEDRALVMNCMSLLDLCYESKYAPQFFKGAVHYLKGSDLAEGTQEVFESNISWLLSFVCTTEDCNKWVKQLGLPAPNENPVDERMKKFAVRCLARCALLLAMCIEAQAILGTMINGVGTPDKTYCVMRQALIFGKSTGTVFEGLIPMTARILQVVLALREDITYGITGGARGTLWHIDSSTIVTNNALAEHMSLVNTALRKEGGK